MTRRGCAAALAAAVGLAGCGKKGPPLAPLPVESEPVARIEAVRWGDIVAVWAPVPRRYTDGRPFELARVEVRAVPQGGEAVPAVPRPPEPERAPFAPGIADRPAPVGAVGRAASAAGPDRFARESERLIEVNEPGAVAEVVARGEAAIEAEVPEDLEGDLAVAVIFHGARRRDRGARSPIVRVDAAPALTRPPAPALRNVEDGIEITLGATSEQPVGLWRRLGRSGPLRPERVGGKPLTAGVHVDSGVAMGETACYAVAGAGAGERAFGPLSPLSCIVRRDDTPPEPPSGVEVERRPQGALVRWRPSPARDVAGYRVWRRRPGGRAEAVSAQPVAGSELLDPDGLRVAGTQWRVTAVDGAEPANESPPTPWVALPPVPRRR